MSSFLIKVAYKISFHIRHTLISCYYFRVFIVCTNHDCRMDTIITIRLFCISGSDVCCSGIRSCPDICYIIVFWCTTGASPDSGNMSGILTSAINRYSIQRIFRNHAEIVLSNDAACGVCAAHTGVQDLTLRNGAFVLISILVLLLLFLISSCDSAHIQSADRLNI